MTCHVIVPADGITIPAQPTQPAGIVLRGGESIDWTTAYGVIFAQTVSPLVTVTLAVEYGLACY